jgi:general secretion pathway protein A
MYERYWRLQRPAFRAEAPAEFFFAGRTQQAALLKLRYLVDQRQGAALLVGAAGCGKSVLLQAFEQQLPTQLGPVVSVLFPQLTTIELLSYLAGKLGVPDAALDRPQLRTDGVLRLLEAQLRDLHTAGRHPILVLDDADLIEDRYVFQALQLLLNFRRPDAHDFSLLLVGQPELAGQVKRLAPFQERLAFVCHLQPLDRDETGEYVRHRLQAAGAGGEIFDAGALDIIHQLSHGLPRRINRLCDFALLVGYADNLEQISATQVQAVAEELTAVAA